jgi:hypothetical protein
VLCIECSFNDASAVLAANQAFLRSQPAPKLSSTRAALS